MKQLVTMVCTSVEHERVPFTPLCRYEGVYTEGAFMRIFVRSDTGKCERIDIHAPKVGHRYKLNAFCGKDMVAAGDGMHYKDVFGEAVLEVIEVTDAP
jgi:hypothetical protein